jgi:phenylacetate-CoA ligase
VTTHDPTDADRYPTLTAHGRQVLDFMREHPCAPKYRNESGNRLLAEDVAALHAYEKEVLADTVGWPVDGKPNWLPAFLRKTFDEVPFYRSLGSAPRRLEDVPTASRAEFAANITQFVPDPVPLDRLINFRTSGTTGHPLLIASHPLVAGRYLAFHKRALRRFGVALTHGRGQVGVVLLGHQRHCFTYVSLTPTMDESGLAKINLHPADWLDPTHRAEYIDALAPEVLAGDPISFGVLLDLPLKMRPKAVLSVSMALSQGLRQRLSDRFGCPVLDVYSLNEAGPVGVMDPALDAHVLLQPKLYVEILDRDGRPLPPGQRGEVTLTGGFNFCLPLLRYRTGDYASLAFGPDGPMLVGLSGRPPVRFRTRTGEWLNNIDVTHALTALPLSQFGLHQAADGALTLKLAANSMAHADAARRALKPLFAEQQLSVVPITADDKIVQYTSDLAGAMP